MLLVLDVGSTNIKLGLFENNSPELIASWRVSTLASRTSDEFGMILYDLFATKGISFEDIDGIIMSSVAPSLNYTIEHMCRYYMKKMPMVVDHTVKTGLTLCYDHPAELGADRIVTAAAAYSIYGGPVIIVDFGSATTFNAVDKDGRYLGGAIAPGIKTATEALVNTAAKLPRIELIPSDKVIATSTVEGMRSGVIIGYTGLVHYMLKRMKMEKGLENAKVVATGGLSQLIQETESQLIDTIDRALTLKGLRVVYEMNKTEKSGKKTLSNNKKDK